MAIGGYGVNQAAKTDLVGEILGGSYKVERKIGQGGMGAVYEATHVRVPRRFAIKMLNEEALANEEVFNRFKREAEIASSLGHDNIIEVFDFNKTDDGIPFMVLEFLEGEDLEQYLKQNGKCDLLFINTIFEQIASGLEATHARGIVHRDLKPANIFLTKSSRGRIKIKILDFGISKIGDSTTMVTKAGAVFGTPDYMSPEQADGRNTEIDARTDVFALGSIITECITGIPAFKSETLMGTLYKIVNGSPLSIAEHAPECPKLIVDSVEAALEKDLNKRTPSVWDFYEQFVQGCPLDARLSTDTQSQEFAIASPSAVNTSAALTENTESNPPPPSRFPLKIIIPVLLGLLALGYLLIRPSAKDAGDGTATGAQDNKASQATSPSQATKDSTQDVKEDVKAPTPTTPKALPAPENKAATTPTTDKNEANVTPHVSTKKAARKKRLRNPSKRKQIKTKTTTKKTSPKKAWDPLSDR